MCYINSLFNSIIFYCRTGKEVEDRPNDCNASRRLFCICRQPEGNEKVAFLAILPNILIALKLIKIFIFSYNRLMICCDQCGEWFHVNCIGITEADAANMDDNDTPYICNKCKQQGMNKTQH